MKTIASLMLSLLLFAGWLAVADTAPAPEAQARVEGDEAKERNEARDRPARSADHDEDDDAHGAAAAPAAGHDAQVPAAKAGAGGDKDDDHDDEHGGEQGHLSLTASQQEAVGIRIESPRALEAAPSLQAYGTVLDPVALLTDAGRIDSTRAAAEAASADATRQAGLYREGAQTSLKTLQAAQAQSVESQVQAQAALASFRQQWGPLAAFGPEQRRALMAALDRGQRLLVRAEVPGQHFAGPLEREALVDVDGVHLSARVLGPLARVAAGSQSAGWLLEVEHAPPGLGPGSRAAVRLRAAAQHGVLVPASALVYEESGAYVYRRIAGDKPDTFAYESVLVKPLTRVGEGWLIEGLRPQDAIVVQGAGVLWSLQGISSFSAAEEEHD
jgi:hypothetical protein